MKRKRNPERADRENPVWTKETFSRARKAREGRNPKTGEKITITARKVPAFVAGKSLKDAVDSKKPSRR